MWSLSHKSHWVTRAILLALIGTCVLLIGWHTYSAAKGVLPFLGATGPYEVASRTSQSQIPSIPPSSAQPAKTSELDLSNFNDLLKEPTPNVVHYVFGMAEDLGGMDFGMAHYLSVMVEPITHVFGNNIVHEAHKADVIRLQMIKEHGGVYLDADMLILHPFPPSFYRSGTVMAIEGHAPNHIVGLCNAFIMAPPNDTFILRWNDRYQDFNSGNWNYHSVQLPAQLWRTYPDEIRVLDHRKLFWPMWWAKHLKAVFTKERGMIWNFESGKDEVMRWDFEKSGQLGWHMWAHVSHEPYLKNLNARDVMRVDTGFNKAVRRFLVPLCGEDGSKCPSGT
ncbi:hypothetical protein HDV00_003861 [Rhizophlyctis rosea]|nr:hypothetical protein HDV00_003861 [Rhizophlyctis rosea]